MLVNYRMKKESKEKRKNKKLKKNVREEGVAGKEINQMMNMMIDKVHIFKF